MMIGRLKILTMAVQRGLGESRLYRDYPFLVEYDAERVERELNLKEKYDGYVTSVSKADSAISLEVCYLMWFLCERLRPKRLLDTGSGFSSYVFRRYRDDRDPGCIVYSVDDDPLWIGKTERYLLEQRLSVENLMLWDDFIASRPEKFDFILHDIGKMAGRVNTFPEVLGLAGNNSIILLDDMHKPHFREPIKRILRGRSARCYDLSEYTLDGYGRYVWLLWGF